MQIVVYTALDGAWPDAHVPDRGDQLQVLQGELQALTERVLPMQPDVLLVAGFSSAPTLLAALEQVCQALPLTSVLVVDPSPEPELLVRMMQLGVREVLTDAAVQLPAAIERARARARPAAPPSQAVRGTMATRIGFLSAKGGDGSTSLAVNMATALASDASQRVLLMDLAMPFGDADISIWNRTAEHDVADFCHEVHRLDDALLNSMVAQVRPNLHFMPAPEHFDKVIGIEPAAVQQLLQFLSGRYSFILLDLGSHVDPLTLRAWELLDQAVLVSTASVPSLRRLNRLCQLWESLGLSPGQLNVVVNRASAKPDMELSAFERACPGKALRRLPLESEAMKASVMQGQPVQSLQPRSGYARTVAAWAAELCGQPPKEKSLWQRLRKK